jgi:ferredoxin
MDAPPDSGRHLLEIAGFGRLIEAIRQRGYRVAGPKVLGGALCYEELGPDGSLPAGVRDEQAPGRYRLRNDGGAALFGQAVGPHSWKQFLSPPAQRLLTARREGQTLRVEPGERDEGDSRPWAFVGVRPCDLAAIRLRDKVFQGGAFTDSAYAAIRSRLLVVAVSCTEPAGTCFCASLGTGPRVHGGFDLALTEIGEGGPRYLIEAGSPRGEEILGGLRAAKAGPSEEAEAERRLTRAEASMGRSLDPDGLDQLLPSQAESPRWDEIAARCLACGNCTMACPTCFCSTVEDAPNLTGTAAERWRRWDSCFTLAFSYIHGGSVRRSISARYRQWMTHKLATWQAQFGEIGCVGCGRCITWCPAGIDITEEARELRRAAGAAQVPLR